MRRRQVSEIIFSIRSSLTLIRWFSMGASTEWSIDTIECSRSGFLMQSTTRWMEPMRWSYFAFWIAVEIPGGSAQNSNKRTRRWWTTGYSLRVEMPLLTTTFNPAATRRSQ